MPTSWGIKEKLSEEGWLVIHVTNLWKLVFNIRKYYCHNLLFVHLISEKQDSVELREL